MLGQQNGLLTARFEPNVHELVDQLSGTMTEAKRNQVLSFIAEGRRLTRFVTEYLENLPPSTMDRPFGAYTDRWEAELDKGVAASDAIRAIETRLLEERPWPPLSMSEKIALEQWFESILASWEIYDYTQKGPQKRVLAGIAVLILVGLGLEMSSWT